jgi:hypothetical protein
MLELPPLCSKSTNLSTFELEKVYIKIHKSYNVMVVEITYCHIPRHIFCYLLGGDFLSSKKLGNQFHVLIFTMFIFEHSWQLKLEFINMFYKFVNSNP